MRVQVAITKETQLYIKKQKEENDKEKTKLETAEKVALIKSRKRGKKKNPEAVRESESYIVSHRRLNKEQVEVTLRHSDGSKETMFSWKAWWKHESVMTKYVKEKKLRGRLFNRNEEDDQVIEEIVGFKKTQVEVKNDLHHCLGHW